MKKIIFPTIVAIAMVSCNNNSKTEEEKTMPDSPKVVTDSVVTGNRPTDAGAAMAAGNSNAANTGLDTAAVGTGSQVVKDTMHK